MQQDVSPWPWRAWVACRAVFPGLNDLHAFAGGVVDGFAKVELDVSLGEVLDDVAGVRQGTGEPVELSDHEGVAGSADGEGLLGSGTCAVPAGESLVPT